MSDTEETDNSSISDYKIKYPKEEGIIPMKTIEIISDLLNNICEECKDISENININNNLFMTKNIPSISIKDYFIRLSQYTKMNDSTIILILIYIDRFCNNNNISLSFRNIYKLILVAMVSAIKYNEDNFYSSKIYAKLGGLSVYELNYLELQFLISLKFSLFVEKDLFDKYNEYLLSFEEDNDSNEEH